MNLKIYISGIVRSSSIFIPDQSSRESDNYNDNWSRIGQGSFSVDSDDSTDAWCFKVSLADKLLEHRKEEFKLPNIKKSLVIMHVNQ